MGLVVVGTVAPGGLDCRAFGPRVSRGSLRSPPVLPALRLGLFSRCAWGCFGALRCFSCGLRRLSLFGCWCSVAAVCRCFGRFCGRCLCWVSGRCVGPGGRACACGFLFPPALLRFLSACPAAWLFSGCLRCLLVWLCFGLCLLFCVCPLPSCPLVFCFLLSALCRLPSVSCSCWCCRWGCGVWCGACLACRLGRPVCRRLPVV